MIKSHFAIVFLLLFAGISFSQSGWIEYPTGTTKTIGGIYFLNESTGFFVADTAAVFKSTNGGLTWSRKVISYVEPNGLAVVKFINNLTGFAAGGYEASGPYGGFYFQYIYKTTNGGDNWFLHYNIQGGGNCQFNDLYCSTENIFVTGEGVSGGIGWASTGGIYKSTNGGTNFVLSFTKGASTSLSFINPSTGWVNSYWMVDYGMTTGFLMKTTNGGVNWIEQIRDSVPNLTAIKINKVQFVNENTGFAIAIKSGTKFLKSTNGGTNWVYNTFPNGENTLLYFTDASTGWIAGVSSPDTSGISRTTDGGTTWTRQNQGNPGTIYSLHFINGMTGWAGKANGKIMKTVNGGIDEPDYAAYFPMHVGNMYLYHWENWGLPSSGGYFRARITKDTVMNAHKYYYLINFPDIGTGWVRYDSSRTNLLYYFPNANCSGYTNDKIIDSLSARINNQVNSCVYHWSYSRCEDTANQLLFNTIPVKTKSFRHDGLMLAHIRYAKNFGIKNFDSGEPPPSTYFVSLVGCYINGVLFGDTTLTYISKLNTGIPSSFSLGQNYPNPFNNSSKFKVQNSKLEHIKIAVYDINGKEVQTLVNEVLQPGTYEVTFDGSGLNSGVYFYQLIAGNYRETRKMVLIK